ncbi:hypothetical protein BWI84_28685 (plasmid) [Escherichia coli]|nr:hypothetical protein BWI84_28685 [Escherichia coli]
MWQGKMQLQGVRENMEVAVTLRLLAHSVASAPAVRCGGRYLHTDKSKGIRHDKQGKKRMRRCVFP